MYSRALKKIKPQSTRMSFIKPVLLHAVDPSALDTYVNWYASVKLDGVRALWDGRQLYTRSGNVIHAPASWLSALPSQVGLDGELYWAGHFPEVNGMARRQHVRDEEAWTKHVRFHVFDIWDEKALTYTFEDRYGVLQRIVREHPSPVLRLVRQTRIRSPAQLRTMYHTQVEQRGAEGLVVRDPLVPYEAGRRSRRVLKWKPKPDAEAKVVGFVPGKGKFAGALGAFEVTWRQGVRFRLAGRLSAEERRQYVFNSQGSMVRGPGRRAYAHLPRLGDCVTFQYMTVSKRGRPRQPVYLRVRHMKKTR